MTAYPSGQASKQSRKVQQYVKGEASSTDYGFFTVGPLADEPEVPVHTIEPWLTNKIDLAEELQKGEVIPTPTPQRRRYSVDWDPLQ